MKSCHYAPSSLRGKGSVPTLITAVFSAARGGPDPAHRLIYLKDNISVGIKTWGELIEENRWYGQVRVQRGQSVREFTVSRSPLST